MILGGPSLAGRDGDGAPDHEDAFPDDPLESLDRNRNGLGDDFDALSADLRAASVALRRAARRLPSSAREAGISAAQDLDEIGAALRRPLGSTARTVVAQGRRFRRAEAGLATLALRSETAEAVARLASFRRYLERAGGDTAIAAFERERAESNAPAQDGASADPRETIRVLFESIEREDASRLANLLHPEFFQADASGNAYDRTGVRNALAADFRMLDSIDHDYDVISADLHPQSGVRRVRIRWDFRTRVRPNFEEWILRGKISTLDLRLTEEGWRIAKIEGHPLFARSDIRGRISIDAGTLAGATVTTPRVLTESGLE